MQTFDTPEPISAVLDVPGGRVQFIAADRTDTTVEVLPANPSKGRDVKAAEQTTVEYRDGVLRIAAAPAKYQALGPTGSLEVTVKLPAGSHVEAKAAAAEFRAVGRLGDVAFDGANGPAKLDEAASVRLTAFDSDVTVGRLSGAADITTQRGDITITEASHGAVVLRTQLGNVSVSAAPGVSASLDASTGTGRIHNSLKNAGGTNDLAIHVTTGYGDITARGL
jgi:Putative adhesin